MNSDMCSDCGDVYTIDPDTGDLTCGCPEDVYDPDDYDRDAV